MAQPAQIESVPLPEVVREVHFQKFAEGEIARWALEAIVVEAAPERIVSLRKAASLLGYEDYASREAFFGRHRLNAEYTLEMRKQDLRAIDILEAENIVNARCPMGRHVSGVVHYLYSK